MKLLTMEIKGCLGCPFMFMDTDQNQCRDIARCGNPDTPIRKFENRGNRQIAERWVGRDTGHGFPPKGYIAPFCPLPDLKQEGA